jgi:hypothetical protein
MKAIGGYFELELRRGEEYHSHALRLNTGRNALEFILRSRKYSKVYIPYYTCDVILEPFNKLGVKYEFYSIDKNLEPKFDYLLVKKNEGFLFTNYFGIKDDFITMLSSKSINLIIDNSQAFYSLPIGGIDTFYSCRKFFGVPDGAYLYMEGADSSDLPVYVSVDRFLHLIKRLEYGPEVGYEDFITNERKLVDQPIMQMSNLTHSLLCSIDYRSVKERRKENFKLLNDNLLKYNELNITNGDNCIPMAYPFLSNQPDLRHKLIENKIFVATYWSNVLKWVDVDQWEYNLAYNILPLPIDQRYGKAELGKIIKLVKNRK